MKFVSGKYGEGVKESGLKKLGLEKSRTLSSAESKELAMLRRIAKAKALSKAKK